VVILVSKLQERLLCHRDILAAILYFCYILTEGHWKTKLYTGSPNEIVHASKQKTGRPSCFRSSRSKVKIASIQDIRQNISTRLAIADSLNLSSKDSAICTFKIQQSSLELSKAHINSAKLRSVKLSKDHINSAKVG
jgi:hypothetical protein